MTIFNCLFVSCCELFLPDRDPSAVSNDPSPPVTVPQTKRSPKLGSKSPKIKKSRKKQSVPDIEVTYANVSDDIRLYSQEEQIYDNAKNRIYLNVGKPGEVYRPEHEDNWGLYNLDLGMLDDWLLHE